MTRAQVRITVDREGIDSGTVDITVTTSNFESDIARVLDDIVASAASQAKAALRA